MNIGDIRCVHINGTRLKMRLEEDGCYCYIPINGKLVCFNMAGFKILLYLSEGYTRKDIIIKLSEEFMVEPGLFEHYLDAFFKYLLSLKIINTGTGC